MDVVDLDLPFDFDNEISNIVGDEVQFFTKEEFKTVVRRFLDKRVENRRRKTFFFRLNYDAAVTILQDKASKLGSSQQRSWLRHTFSLRDLGTPVHPILQLIKTQTEIPVCPYDRIYSILCNLHSSVHQHVGTKAMWNTVSKTQ